jgi:hypothetical protein
LSISGFAMKGDPPFDGADVQFSIWQGEGHAMRLYNYTAASELAAGVNGAAIPTRNNMPPFPNFPTGPQPPVLQSVGLRLTGPITGEERLPIRIEVRNLGATAAWIMVDAQYQERVTTWQRGPRRRFIKRWSRMRAKMTRPKAGRGTKKVKAAPFLESWRTASQ